MTDVPTGQLFLGETIDGDRQRTGERVLVKAADLTTHGVIVGMTGSGKTGLGVGLVEEALLQGIPTLVLDPKGDLGNLLLAFPNLSAESFAPWVEGADPAEVATAWREGLTSWGIDGTRLQALRDAADFTIYTPGSTAGVPLNVVGSLQRPPAGTDDETMGDEVQGYVSGLLDLVGIDADPLASREHILLANLVRHAWDQGHDLDLAALVAQVQSPPLRKLGVFELDEFFPPADRTELALRLHRLLASPGLAAWGQGQALDIDALLRPGGRPGCAIVSLAHLSDEERQFVVTLVLGKLVTWMRRQPGTDTLRALVYFDEVVGFVPPSAAPPAKGPILTLLKQARAFGVGLVLATQNPVDVDYKALSNAGTWMIGRLQTEQDKARLLDGLSAAAGGVDVGAVGADGGDDVVRHLAVGGVVDVAVVAAGVLEAGHHREVPAPLPQPEVWSHGVAADGGDLGRERLEGVDHGLHLVGGGALDPAEQGHVTDHRRTLPTRVGGGQSVSASSRRASVAGPSLRRAQRVLRNRSTPSITRAARTEGNTSKACCAPCISAYRTGWSLTARRRSTKARASSTGARRRSASAARASRASSRPSARSRSRSPAATP